MQLRWECRDADGCGRNGLVEFTDGMRLTELAERVLESHRATSPNCEADWPQMPMSLPGPISTLHQVAADTGQA
ncbi:MAG: hypothetical protein HY397_03175 [Candidatus Doudnabacteria bacterium]|nr:hypothetical protein [Candidatus Doudnabacteria bacterium]